MRTFWEKMTILHKVTHRLEENPEWHIPEPYSRHYYDIYRLAQSGILENALADQMLADAVREAAQIFFEDRKARYENFSRGSIRLIPSKAGMIALKRDYAAMRDIIFGEYPTMAELMAEIARVESAVNSRD